MNLSRLYIENYRSIKKLDLKFEKGKNIIVGKNNSGKSNIIKAIDLVLGESSPTWGKSENITDNDFFQGNTGNEIFIWCELTRDSHELLPFNAMYENCTGFKMHSQVTEWENRKPKFRELIRHDISLSNRNHNLDSIFVINEDSVGYDTEWIDLKKKDKQALEKLLSNMYHFAFCFKAYKNEKNKIIKEIRFLIREKESNNWALSFRDSLRNELLQSAIIPSFRDPNNQLRITHYNWYGKLLKECIKKDDEELNNAFSKVKDASNKLFKELQDKITCEKTQIAFPNTKISFQFNPDTKQDIYKSTLIYVDDGFNSKLDEKGSGIQSAVIIGLFDYYIRHIAHSTGSSLLAIEEPELYLHPHGGRVISDRLNDFLDGHKNQVILTTHSPEFICSPHEDINLILVTKNKETFAKNFNFSDTKTKQVLIKKQNAEMFFADAVILVEGADKYILESMAEEFGNKTKINLNGTQKGLGKNWLNDYNISIINCGGKMEFWKYVKIFNELDMPWLIITDFDFLRDGLNDFFTKLSWGPDFINNLNSLKSKITITGKYKSISEIGDELLKQKIKGYILKLSKESGIHILTGELENFYKMKPKFSKEPGVIETISKQIEENKTIEDYIEIDEFVNALKVFTKNCLKLELIENETEQ